MKKTYKSYSVYGTTIITKKGARIPVQFKPYSFGGGIYFTCNEDIQEALENDSAYGRHFYLHGTEETSEPKKEEEVKEEVNVQLKDVEVSDISEAKDYLVENFGIKKASLRSSNAIRMQAQEHGINFVGI